MSLRTKFFAAFSVLGFSILLTSSLGFYYFEYRQILAQQESTRLRDFEKLFTVCRESEIEKNYIPVINFVKVLAGEKHIMSARCVDGTGRIRADTWPELIGSLKGQYALPGGEIFRREYVQGDTELLELSQRRSAGKSSVAVAVTYNASYFKRETKTHLLGVIKRILSVFVVTITPVIFIISFFFATALTKPIYLMEQASREFGAGNFGYSLEMPDTGDEISELSKSLVDMARKLSELDNMKQRFFANITHDLRSPLSAVQGYADLILSGMMGPVTEKQSEGLKIILGSTHRLDNYIDDILDLAKLQSGSFELKLAEMNVGNSVRSVAEMFKAQADKHSISLKADIRGDLPTIKADEKLIHRCVSNFVSNAFKFTPRGGDILIGASLEVNFVRVYVKDTGPGIPKDKVGFVFDKFFQVAETKEYARKAGTGLGLTITKEIIQLHGGRAWVESEFGKGSTFIFTLPA